jgi:hypothetical protein
VVFLTYHLLLPLEDI